MPNETLYRLAGATTAEPLINKWVAWSHLLSPVPYSLHLLQYQTNLLQSYLRFPSIHIQTCQNPELRYGPFIDIPERRAGEVKELLDGIKSKQSANLLLAQSLKDFQNHLLAEAKGQSLEPFYRQVPDPLRGYVELIYDYHNHPIVRPFERLLYESPYYDPSLQSLRLFQQERDNSRQFFMSTPRLMKEDQIDWVVPFESDRVDEFFKLDTSPQPLGHVREVIGLSPGDEHLLESLLSKEDQPPPDKWRGGGARIRYIGHACVLIEYNGITILTDPWVPTMPKAGGMPRVTFADLPAKIDYALITHGHPDHFGLETLLRLRHRIGTLVVQGGSGIFYGDISLKLLTQKIGFKNVVEMTALDSIKFEGGEIICIPFMGEHADLPHGKAAYVLRIGDEQIMFGADSNCLDERMYEHIRKLIGPIETVFIGMECVGAPLSWMYQPLFPIKPDHGMDQSRRLMGCDSTRAMQILEAVGAKRVYIYAMGLEPWLEYQLGLAIAEDSVQIKEAKTLIEKASEKGLTEAKLLCGTYDIHLADAGTGAKSKHADR